LNDIQQGVIAFEDSCSYLVAEHLQIETRSCELSCRSRTLMHVEHMVIRNWPKYLALGLGVLISAFGIAVLIAWSTHYIPLIQVGPDQPPLTRQAAIGYVLSGAALVLLSLGHRRLAAVCASIVLLQAVLVSVEYFVNRDLGIDELLGPGYITENASPPGRISPIAAICYFLDSLALLLLSIPRLDRYSSAIAGIIGSVLIAVGSVLFIVYRVARMPTYGWGHFRHISIQASAAVAFLGFGILSLAVRESWTRKRLPSWLPLAVGLSVAAGSVGIWQAVLGHVESQLPVLSHIILVGGILCASLLAIAIHQTQLAIARSRILREGRAAYGRLLDASADTLLVVDRYSNIVSANQRVNGMFGYTAEEIVGSPIESLVPGFKVLQNSRDRSIHTPIITPLGQRTELCGQRKDGSAFPMELALTTVQTRGEFLLAAVRDITERRRLEEDLEATRLQAIAAARLSALGMMAGGIAHEINNPVGIIHAMASDLTEMVQEDGSVPPETVAQKSAVIRQTSERIARIVKSLRQISREGTADPLRSTPLAQIVAETLEICRAKFKANGVELILPQAIPEVSVLCREVQISQALLNLLQNAFDAVAEQRGEGWVRLEVQSTDESVALSVIDSGPGIPLELRSRVGEPFFTTKPVGKGTGLGLSLSKSIAQDHGGDIEYGVDQGRTRFSLVLPLGGKVDAA
jgi:PAS domain S-box-containing protein